MEQSVCEKFYIYFTWGFDGLEFNLTSNPDLTIRYLYQSQTINDKNCYIGVIGPSLKIGEAYYLSKLLKASFKPSIFKIFKVSKEKNNFFSMVDKINQQLAYIARKSIFHGGKFNIRLIDLRVVNPSILRSHSLSIINQDIATILTSEILSVLQGRILYREEIIQYLMEHGYQEILTKLTPDFLEGLRLNQIIEILPSVTYQCNEPFKKDVLHCRRCGQSNSIYPIKCIGCGGTCYYCESCVAMGEATLCRPLYKWKLPKPQRFHQFSQGIHPFSQGIHPFSQGRKPLINKPVNSDPLAGINLTPAQLQAYIGLKRFVMSPEEKALLIAVCGAGKTEIVFGAIELALNKGKRVLFAIPRTDVVLELLPRLKKAFPQYNPIPLYGGSPDKYKNSQLIIATTHQTLRFAEAFDLVILDEVDAFPYKGSQMLKYAVERAKRKTGKIIYMTATPGQELLSESKKGNWTKLTIPVRHHGHPVPEPNFIIEKSTSLVTPKISDFIIRTLSENQYQLFIFVPSIDLAEKVCKFLREKFAVSNLDPNLIQYSHSKDKHREMKREQFSQGNFPIFITTSIMERGVTVPKANVLVLFAHWEKIYDQGTLIQMAGRAGRSKAFPYGEVIFHGEQITGAMAEARSLIINLNKEAYKAGYLIRSKSN